MLSRPRRKLSKRRQRRKDILEYELKLLKEEAKKLSSKAEALYERAVRVRTKPTVPPPHGAGSWPLKIEVDRDKLLKQLGRVKKKILRKQLKLMPYTDYRLPTTQPPTIT